MLQPIIMIIKYHAKKCGKIFILFRTAYKVHERNCIKLMKVKLPARNDFDVSICVFTYSSRSQPSDSFTSRDLFQTIDSQIVCSHSPIFKFLNLMGATILELAFELSILVESIIHLLRWESTLFVPEVQICLSFCRYSPLTLVNEGVRQEWASTSGIHYRPAIAVK